MTVSHTLASLPGMRKVAREKKETARITAAFPQKADYETVCNAAKEACLTPSAFLRIAGLRASKDRDFMKQLAERAAFMRAGVLNDTGT